MLTVCDGSSRQKWRPANDGKLEVTGPGRCIEKKETSRQGHQDCRHTQQHWTHKNSYTVSQEGVKQTLFIVSYFPHFYCSFLTSGLRHHAPVPRPVGGFRCVVPSCFCLILSTINWQYSCNTLHIFCLVKSSQTHRASAAQQAADELRAGGAGHCRHAARDPRRLQVRVIV